MYRFRMKNKFSWAILGLLAAVVAGAGCGSGEGSASGGGTPVPPASAVLTMYSSSANFGDVAVGSSVTLGVTFANTGGSSLTLQQNSVSGAGFVTNGIGSGVTLGPGQYVTLAVTFNPLATGNATGMASISSSTASSAINVPFSGNAVVPTHWAAFDWAASPSSVVGYNVYRRAETDTSWNKLNSSPITASAYTDWDVQTGDSYVYGVTAVSATNIESRLSNVAEATIPTP